ncbi:glycoside hydrolase/deacetylase [Basidiobolus meristosporus CBS 931.73]|uniref:Glycoside hydrolase/deacetylase n=1 Tax=Basidiobolus meristosporus CBS 931.73 TaxID=1314790 RepID=A0A1Y1YLF7_9FUNG|nr:glycoside hydrolase/deacetylase [Basidiobolus meristosporus CBS 931.73]|eukprot:ORX98414.1 glycoside hydrolase/deacetylase [Basidiobolus meristosporus CBS 931.73]
MVRFEITLLITALVAGAKGQDVGGGIVLRCAKPGTFAMTFDDGNGLIGPSPFTPQLLDILKERSIRATFFVLGTHVRNPALAPHLKRAFDEGHQIALHTDTHPHLNTLTPEKIRSELNQNGDSVKEIIGSVPNYMRPPYGECNQNTREVIQEMGFLIVNWNVDSNDWQYHGNSANHDLLLENMAVKINPSDSLTQSFISLQHDTEDFSVARVPQIIDLIISKGFHFETVADCLGNVLPMYRGAPNNNNATAPRQPPTTTNSTFKPSITTATQPTAILLDPIVTQPPPKKTDLTPIFGAIDTTQLFKRKLHHILYTRIPHCE